MGSLAAKVLFKRALIPRCGRPDRSNHAVQ
jgi:hypothetical protein